MRDPRTIINALLTKTVANGCTQPEEAAAVAKARDLVKQYGLDEAMFSWPGKPATKKQVIADVDLSEVIRRAKKPKPDPFRARPDERVGGYCERLLRESTLSYANIAAAARAEFGSKTQEASVRWYATQMRKRGQEVPRR